MVYVLPWKRESWQRVLEARRLWASAASLAGRLEGKSRASGKKGLQSERGSRMSGSKVGHLGKGKTPRGYHSVCQELFTAAFFKWLGSPESVRCLKSRGKEKR